MSLIEIAQMLMNITNGMDLEFLTLRCNNEQMKCTSSIVKSKVDKTHAILNYKTNNLFVYSK